jgi:hypothetical protein
MKHPQYICSTCGRCICAESDSENRYRIKNPFKSLEIAKLYLRAAEAIYEGPCGIYETMYSNGRILFKIFRTKEDMEAYLEKNTTQSCPSGRPLFKTPSYKPYRRAQIRKLGRAAVELYLKEKTG